MWFACCAISPPPVVKAVLLPRGLARRLGANRGKRKAALGWTGAAFAMIEMMNCEGD